MSLNMYLGEVQSQTQSMNAICNATIQSMEQAIQSIDAFAIDTVLQGQTYSSAKAYLVQTFRPLAQGIMCLCEELIRQNEAFPNDFQAKVASTDVIEHEIRQQIQEINQSIASIEAIEVLTPMPGVDAIIAVLIAMRKKLEEKLERLYEFNHSSSNNYSTALQLAASITAGLAEVQSGKGFSPVSGTFHSEKLNMEWAKQIQIIIEEKIRKSDNGIGKSVDLEQNVYNDIEGISSENISIDNRFTKEEIQATQKYLEGIKNGTIKGNIGEDFQVETDDYEMEHNIFGQPVGGRRPVLDPFLIGVAKFGFDFLFGDLFTLFDPEATYGEKLLAVGMMTPYGKGVKIVDKLHDLKKVGDVKKATSGSAGVAKGMDNAGEKTSGLNSSVKNVNPSEIRFSQTSVNGSEELIASMKANGWKGDPIDVVKMPDGKLTTIDNTRVAAAREVGIEVQATIRNYKDPLPTNLIDRFTTKKGVPKTWGEALDLRILKQKTSFRNNNPMGSFELEKMK
ncbi:T7SS effector LXG polymorphic toxin [Bacillus albus]|uniref:T7SS effector LXG polymorphic toxin n=1 Tax=Bacillus cereus group TaxID=86661 RepID=UPI0022E9682C|nr:MULTISPECIES: T7SS effector LXG polymorphic toxin [Bacillus cereus group]MDA2025610.1 T7SS effector LXG polymorphic toxin [Bacillus cereus group sp. Bcc03]MDA2216370.1 T7SS effector LXG polymorphic toxin [Bacillus cereus group sp. Bc228]MDA2228021.1 T7SS effector LXG polymorphic toxin [Bacillus cereus group sp. Bc227]MDA2260367.1 T7SS effector LXG polymorphic toxin [Bacillus cereus group sp. Bc200]MDA2322953.1 T7SS effector LXG polymorphic toxin [Bacillus cereus group sp. Bc177]